MHQHTPILSTFQALLACALGTPTLKVRCLRRCVCATTYGVQGRGQLLLQEALGVHEAQVGQGCDPQLPPQLLQQ